MAKISLYFHVHQPFRIKPYTLFDIGQDRDYFSGSDIELDNREILLKVAHKCYLPANALLMDLLKDHKDFKVSFSISGVFLEQAQLYMPELVTSFRELVQTGKVELLADTYHHSLAAVKSWTEFREQVAMHRELMQDLFDYSPTAFRNTELIYNDDLAVEAEKLGFETILAEGVDRHLGWRSANYIYRPAEAKKIKLMLKNYKLSDDIAFRFSDKKWSEWPLTPKKFAGWLGQVEGDAQVVNLFMDYETLGEHQWVDTGIFEFISELPSEVLKISGFNFTTISEAARDAEPVGVVSMPEFTSWADSERDISAWLGNPMQNSAIDALYALENDVKQSLDKELYRDWQRLTTSDHLYYMSTKDDDDGVVHRYFSPYNNPFDAYTAFMNVVHDIRVRCGMSAKIKPGDIDEADDFKHFLTDKSIKIPNLGKSESRQSLTP